MKKLVLLLIFLVAGAAAAAPFWFGMQTEEAYRKLVAAAGKDSGVTMTLTSYERGWLDSRAKVNIGMPGVPVTVTATDTIHHGPIPIPIPFEIPDPLSLEPVLAAIDTQVDIQMAGGGAKLPLTMNTTIHLDGRLVSKIRMAPVKQKISADSSIDWQGLTGELRANSDLTQTRATITMPRLQITGAKGGMTLTNLGVSTDLRPGKSGIHVGNTSYSIGRLAVDDANTPVTLSDFGFQTDLSEAGDTLNANINIKFKEFSGGGQSFGPGALALQIRKIDAASIAKLNKVFSDLRNSKIPPDQMAGQVAGHLLPIVIAIARKAPEAEVTRLSVKTGDGEITGKAHFVLDPGDTKIEENPMLLLAAFSGEGELLIPNTVVLALTEKEIRRKLEGFKSSGTLTEAQVKRLTPEAQARIVVEALPLFADSVAQSLRLQREGKDYKITANIKRGQVLVNNQPLALH